MKPWTELSNYIDSFINNKKISTRISTALIRYYWYETRGLSSEEIKNYIIKKIKESDDIQEFSKIKNLGSYSLNILRKIKEQA